MMRIGSKLLRIFVLFSVLLSYTPFAFPQGQTTGSIQGRAYDVGTNLPLAGVTITATNRDNGLERTTVTSADGTYVIAILPPAIYSIRATVPGYDTDPLPDFAVHLGKTNVVQPPPFAMRKLGGQSPAPTPEPVQTVKTSGSSIADTTSKSEQLTNTVNPTRSSNFDTRQLVTLPLPATRTFDDLAFLAAGVAPPPQLIGTIAGPGVGPGVGTSGQFSVNGARARSNNFTIDGSDNNDPDIGVRRQGFVALVPQTPESVQEFQIATLLWDSEFGRNLGSQANAVSKAGGKSLHGQAYGFFTDSSLNARNAFDFLSGPSAGEDPYTKTLAGFAIGGPLSRNRTQFFVSFEHQDINASVEQHFSVPTANERRFAEGEFTFLNPGPSPPGSLFVQTENGTTPIGQTALSAYPFPNNPGGLYGINTLTRSLPADGDGSVFSFKIAHQLTQKHAISARYNLTDDSRILPSVNRAIDSTIDSNTRTQNLSLILDSAISTTISNQARFSFGRTRLDFPEFPTSPFVFEKSAVTRVKFLDGNFTRTAGETISLSTGDVGQITIEPFSPVGIDAFTFPQNRLNNTFQYADTLSKVIGKHSLKVGADIRRLHLDSSQQRLYRPSVLFGSGLLARSVFDLDVGQVKLSSLRDVTIIPGVQLAAAGVQSSVLQTLTADVPNPKIELRSTEYNFFINDNWHVKPNFTLDYGLRYEYNSRPSDKRIDSAISLQNLPAASRSEFRALFPGAPADEVDVSFDNLVGAFDRGILAYSKILDGRTKVFERDFNNLAPRLGFAWDLGSNGKNVVRGGYGIYYDAILGAVVSQSRNVFPNEIPFNLDVSFLIDPLNFFPNPSELFFGSVPLVKDGTPNQFGGTPGLFSPLIGALFLQNSLAGGLAFTLPEKNLRTPYAQHWHLTMERQIFDDYLVSAGYVGTKGTKLTRLTTPNGGSSVTPFVPFTDRIQFQGDVVTLPFSLFFPFTDVITAGTNRLRELLGVKSRQTPDLGPYQLFENSANSTYHALQFEFRKRYSHGYSFTAAYTWSHALDDVSDVFPIAGAPVVAQDSRNLSLERADANFDVRHRIAASLIWDLPFYRNSTGGAANLLGGWQIASVFRAHTGQPFTLSLPVDANLDGNLTDRPSTTQGLTFFDGHGSQKVSAGSHPFTDFLNLGQDGFVARNSVRADTFVNLDMALNKHLRFTENQRLEIRTEFFNLFNRTNYGIPVRVIGAPGFGSSVDTVSPARTVQFALKYSF